MPDISLIVIKTDKLKEQAEFYIKLGFRFEYHQHGNGPYHYASKESNVILEIYPLPKAVTVPDNTTRLGFMVEGLDELISEMNDEVIISAPRQTDWGYTAVIQDLDGRKIELTQSDKPS